MPRKRKVDHEREGTPSPGPTKAKSPAMDEVNSFRMSKSARIVIGGERNKAAGTIVDILAPPRGEKKFMKVMLLLEDCYVKIVSYGENSTRLHDIVKNAKGKHATFKYMYARWEDAKFVDEKYGKLIQLNFNPESEVQLANDGYVFGSLEEEKSDNDVEGDETDGQGDILMLADVAKTGTYHGVLHVKIVGKLVESRTPAKAGAEGPVRYGTCVTDGTYKSEAYFVFPEAKKFLPGTEIDMLKFKAYVNGAALKLTVWEPKDVRESDKSIALNTDEDDIDYPPVTE